MLLALGALQKEMEAQAAAGIKPGKKETGVYPPALALGCTWNPEIVEECESTVAKELGSKRIDMILGPCINIHRDPLHGRLSETFTEDPMLMGVMGSAAVRGIPKLIQAQQPQVVLFGASSVGRDLAPRISHPSFRSLSADRSGA